LIKILTIYSIYSEGKTVNILYFDRIINIILNIGYVIYIFYMLA